MGMFTNELIELRGYIQKEGDVYVVSTSDYYLDFDYIRSLIIDMTTVLSETLYPTANISEFITALQTATFGPEIRTAIYNIFKEFARVSGIYIAKECASIRLAHFGRDMREPIYDALIKLGIEGDLYYDAVSSDFRYIVDNGVATLNYYIGGNHPYMKLPEKVEDPEDPETMVDVVCLASTLFNDNEWIKDVVIPDAVTQIM